MIGLAIAGDGRAQCNGCSAHYDPKWAGTTCSVCDGDILPVGKAPCTGRAVMWLAMGLGASVGLGCTLLVFILMGGLR
jgi:hypothetical protein